MWRQVNLRRNAKNKKLKMESRSTTPSSSKQSSFFDWMDNNLKVHQFYFFRIDFHCTIPTSSKGPISVTRIRGFLPTTVYGFGFFYHQLDYLCCVLYLTVRATSTSSQCLHYTLLLRDHVVTFLSTFICIVRTCFDFLHA